MRVCVPIRLAVPGLAGSARWAAVRSLVCGVALTLAGCSGQPTNFGSLPRISIPLEEETPARPPPAKKAPPAETVALDQGDAPDPPPSRSKEQVNFHFSFQRGELLVLEQKALEESQLLLTPRRVGRFAVELYLGPQLIERVRFDFPLLGASGDEEFEKGLTTDTHVLVPLLADANRARLLDRKTRRSVELVWPPQAPAPPEGPQAPESPPAE